MTISKKIKLEIIILNYNTSQLTIKLIKSLLIDKPPDWQITLVDNHSRAEEIAILKANLDPKKVNFLSNQANLGFAAGNNQALKKSQAKYILLLNSDIETSVSTIKKLLDYLEKNPQIAAITPKLVLANGQLDWACHRGFPTPWSALTYFLGLEKIFPRFKLFSQYHQKYKNLNQPHPVDAISGAFFLARYQPLKEINFFDESYFMYGEDIDLCYRLKKKGYLIYYYPHLKAIHFKHKSGLKSKSKQNVKTTKNYFYSAMETFYNKHYAKKYPKVFNLLVVAAIKLLSKTNFK